MELSTKKCIVEYVVVVKRRDSKDLQLLLARRHTRRAKKGFRKAQKLERATALPSIENRPQVVAHRKQVGHWEDDTIVSRQSLVRLKTINERVSGIILIGKMNDGSLIESNRVVRERHSGLTPCEIFFKATGVALYS